MGTFDACTTATWKVYGMSSTNVRACAGTTTAETNKRTLAMVTEKGLRYEMCYKGPNGAKGAKGEPERG